MFLASVSNLIHNIASYIEYAKRRKLVKYGHF